MILSPKTQQKIERIVSVYEAKIFVELTSLSSFSIMETQDHLRAVPDCPTEVTLPNQWGGVWSNTWFKTTFEIDKNLTGKTLFIQPKTDGIETMLWVDGLPQGIISKELEVGARGYHHTLMIGSDFSKGDKVSIALECYAGHPCIGCHPHDPREELSQQETHYQFTFSQCRIVERDELVKDFVFDLKTLQQMVQHLPDDSFRKGKVAACLEQINTLVPQIPGANDTPKLRQTLIQAREIMAQELNKKNGPSAPIAGIIGHSHMDTAWLWTTQESIRKCARTFSNALNLMKQYPEYKFVQSSVVHLELIQEHYPEIFAQIKERIAEGRWEPNGASYVEADGNMTGGEAQIRQFSRGMKYLKDEFNYKPDSYWLPDTFGYNAALPQIIKGCGLKYFLTTKLSWNESNTFPYDSFIWRGIDGSEVVAHFNETHCWADPQTLLSRLNGVEEGKFVGEKFSIRHKDVTDKRLIAYGFGDGGGGPMYEMLEMARRVEDLEGIPKAKNMTVSEFMDELVDSSPKMPRYNGELYLELHRGTLTHQHKIKQGNRQMEIAVRALELLDVRQKLNGQEGIAKEDLDALWKTLLINQFHDILPGTSLPEVHDLAIEQYEAALEKATQLSRTREIYGEGTYKLVNSLNWKYTRNISVAVENEQLSAEGVVCETYTDIDDRPRLLMESGLKGLSESSITLSQNGTPLPEISSFYIQNNKVRTPFYEFNLSDEGVLENLLYLPENRTLDLVGKAFNEFIIGEDLPALWDSWDIDYDQQLKMQAVEGHVKTEIIHNGQLHLRIRSTRKIGTASSLVQDVIFYKNTPQIDFETLIDWHEKHMLLQTKFDLNVFTNSIKCEIPFGYVERQTHDNTPVDRACFEFSQHKYSDLSESRFGIAFLNNGKYAIAAEGSTVKLSLLKSGGHPDPRGDEGRHYTTYSVLPHSGPLAVNTVVQAAYELNHLPLITDVDGTLDGNSLCSFSKDNIIVESIKWAEDGNGWVMRVYEAEGSTTQCDMNFSSVNYKVLQTDMLEENGQEVLGGKGIYALNFHAFEIKTIKVCRLAQ